MEEDDELTNTSYFMENSISETSMSLGESSLMKLSRRSRGKSPVVLNSLAARRNVDTLTHSENYRDNQSSEKSKKKMVLKRLNKLSVVDTKRHNAAKKIQLFWRHYINTSKEKSSILLIQKLWRYYCGKNRLFKFTQGRRWSLRSSLLVFSSIVLGRRVRKIMNAPSILRWKESLADVRRVLADIVISNESHGETVVGVQGNLSDIFWREGIANKIIHLIGVGDSKKLFDKLSTSDAALVMKLIEEYVSTLHNIHEFVFSGSCMNEVMGTKYLDLRAGYFRYRIDLEKNNCISKKKLFLPKGTPGAPGSTPPRLGLTRRSRSCNRERGNSSKSKSFESIDMSKNEFLRRSPDILSSPGSFPLLESVGSTPELSRNEHVRRNSYQEVTKISPSRNLSEELRVASFPDISHQDSSSKAVIIFNIISAEKLMPAKKVGSIYLFST